MRCGKGRSKREVYSYAILPQERRKHRVDNLTLYLKQLEKEQANKQTKKN